MKAAHGGHLDVVRELLEAGAQVGARDQVSACACGVATLHRLVVVVALLSPGPRRCLHQHGVSAMLYCSYFRDSRAHDVLKALLAAGGNPNDADEVPRLCMVLLCSC